MLLLSRDTSINSDLKYAGDVSGCISLKADCDVTACEIEVKSGSLMTHLTGKKLDAPGLFPLEPPCATPPLLSPLHVDSRSFVWLFQDGSAACVDGASSNGVCMTLWPFSLPSLRSINVPSLKMSARPIVRGLRQCLGVERVRGNTQRRRSGA